jgi:hypothetical protein
VEESSERKLWRGKWKEREIPVKTGRGESNGKIGTEGRERGSFGGKIPKGVDRKGKGRGKAVERARLGIDSWAP